MTNAFTRIALALILLVPGAGFARAQEAPINVNTRYEVERVAISGIADSRASRGLRDDMQALVGHKYDADAAERLARRLRGELGDRYSVDVKIRRGQEAERVVVVFDVEKTRRQPFDVRFSPLLYTSRDNFSFALAPSVESHHNYFSFGLVSTANDLLERNIGEMLRYEHRRVGTDRVQIGLEYDYFHPSFEGETEAALALAPSVPGIYRTREVFAPSVSVLPVPELKLTFGATFQTLSMQYPVLHDQAAHAFTFTAQYRREVRPRHGARHAIALEYALRDATTSLESDFLYRRHWAGGDYRLRVGRQSLGVHGQVGSISGQAPLFERFSLGSATTLRGWDKFDVAPLGGTRLAYGSLDYQYRPFEVFYDVGRVWDAGRSADVRHSVGVGLVCGNGFFASVGVPLRYHGVKPTFMFGFRR